MQAKRVKRITPLFTDPIRRIGIIARDYNVRFPNGYRDFSYTLPEIIQLLDAKGCDAALFSLYSIIPRKDYDLLFSLPEFKHLRMICLEEFRDCQSGRKAGDYVVYYRIAEKWEEYRFKQAFGRVNWQKQSAMVQAFAQEVMPKRVIGNSCIIVCGETNGVKYDKAGNRKIIDPCSLLEALPPHVSIILNPVHDRMSRFEMMMKRRFLSERGRWVISVWNKGKLDKHSKRRDGNAPPWTVFYDGKRILVCRVEDVFGVDIGVVDLL